MGSVGPQHVLKSLYLLGIFANSQLSFMYFSIIDH